MTETRKRKGESVEDLDAKIQSMEAEMQEGHARPLTWDEVTSTTASEIAAKETRRGILPRLIHAAKVKRKEVELRDREAEAEAVRAKLEPALAVFQESDAELRAAKERRDKAHGDFMLARSVVQGADDRAKRTARELQKLRGDDAAYRLPGLCPPRMGHDRSRASGARPGPAEHRAPVRRAIAKGGPEASGRMPRRDRSGEGYKLWPPVAVSGRTAGAAMRKLSASRRGA